MLIAIEHNREGELRVRKIIVEAEVSVDGAMGGENMDFWKQTSPFHGADVEEYLSELLFMPDALLMGQKTYGFFAKVWPARDGKDADRIDSMPKYVASRTLQEPLQWNAKLIKGKVAEAIGKLKQETGRGVVPYGVREVAHTMLTDGLVNV